MRTFDRSCSVTKATVDKRRWIGRQQNPKTPVCRSRPRARILSQKRSRPMYANRAWDRALQVIFYRSFGRSLSTTHITEVRPLITASGTNTSRALLREIKTRKQTPKLRPFMSRNPTQNKCKLGRRDDLWRFLLKLWDDIVGNNMHTAGRRQVQYPSDIREQRNPRTRLERNRTLVARSQRPGELPLSKRHLFQVGSALLLEAELERFNKREAAHSFDAQ